MFARLAYLSLLLSLVVATEVVDFDLARLLRSYTPTLNILVEDDTNSVTTPECKNGTAWIEFKNLTSLKGRVRVIKKKETTSLTFTNPASRVGVYVCATGRNYEYAIFSFAIHTNSLFLVSPQDPPDTPNELCGLYQIPVILILFTLTIILSVLYVKKVKSFAAMRVKHNATIAMAHISTIQRDTYIKNHLPACSMPAEPADTEEFWAGDQLEDIDTLY